MADDHAADAIGAYRSRLAELNPTPNLDQIAAEGTHGCDSCLPGFLINKK